MISFCFIKGEVLAEIVTIQTIMEKWNFTGDLKRVIYRDGKPCFRAIYFNPKDKTKKVKIRFRIKSPGLTSVEGKIVFGYALVFLDLFSFGEQEPHRYIWNEKERDFPEYNLTMDEIRACAKCHPQRVKIPKFVFSLLK